MLKIYRRLRPGLQPEIEVARFLTEVAGFENTPAFYGSVEYVPEDKGETALAAAFAFVRNQGDAWSVVLDALERHLDQVLLLPAEEAAARAAEPITFAHPLDISVALGRRTAELHAAFATPTDDPAFAAEPVRGEDVNRWVDAAIEQARQRFSHA